MAYVHPNDYVGHPSVSTEVALAHEQAEQEAGIELVHWLILAEYDVKRVTKSTPWLESKPAF